MARQLLSIFHPFNPHMDYFQVKFNKFDSAGLPMKIKTLHDKELELLEKVLAKTNWNLEKASRLLQISLSQVKKKIRAHGLRKPESSS